VTILSRRADVGSLDSIRQLLHLTDKIENPHFKSSTALALRSALHELVNPTTNEISAFATLGHCWISFSILVIELYVPDAPIDPSAIHHCTEQFWQQAESMTAAKIQLHRSLEKHLTGNETNPVIRYLENESSSVKEQLSAVVVIPRREKRDVEKLNTYWSEVLQFLRQVVSPQRLEALLATSNSDNQAAMLREGVFQQSVTGFCQRLDTAYPDYDDISGPLTWCLQQMKLGVRLVMDRSSDNREAISSLVGALVTFPSILSSEALMKEAVTKTAFSTDAFATISLSLHATAFEVSIGVDLAQLVPVLSNTYQQAAGLWLIDRAREKEFIKSGSSLYRRKDFAGDLSDAEQERLEFLELFPDFEDSLESGTSLETQNSSNQSNVIQPHHFRQIFQLHHRLMCGNGITSDSIKIFEGIRRDILYPIFESHFPELSDSLDAQSLRFQSSMLQHRIDSLQQGTMAGVPYNFYHDPNVYEIDHATGVVQKLKKRLDELILEWPDQMVLQHIRDRCDELLALHINSPIARVLLAVERLLLQSEDWEMYANRENSLSVHRRELIDLIVRWRRLELLCWNGLLETEAQNFAEGVSAWWFQLYETLVLGSAAAVNDIDDQTTVDQYLDSLVPLIDDYFAKSSIGQFASRMQLAEDFEIYIQYLVSENQTPHPSVYQRIRRVLRNTTQYYSQFSTSISADLSRHRESLEKEIQSFIKLASWKDINVQALKQSAQRTHHQLYKCIRKFRDGLRRPISTLLIPARAGDAEQKHIHYSIHLSVPSARPRELQTSFPDVVNVNRPLHLIDIGRTFSRFSSLVAHDLRSFIHSCGPGQVDELAVQIIVTANDLAKETVSSSLTKEKREKRLKALFVRKKKACSDLLKELKRAGISANVNPEVRCQQEDRKWMREQPVISTTSDGKVFDEKGYTYFYRLLGLLPELRATAASHHQDITTRELQRGISLLESGVSLALRSRTR
jgi:midasin